MAGRSVGSLIASLVLTAALAPSAASQIVPIRTVPVASGDQFLMLPSQRLGMGGVTLALDDSLADPWSNPAEGTFIRAPILLGSPTLYTISESGGGGRTFPVAALFAGSRWFGGAALAIQQIDNARHALAVPSPLLYDALAWDRLPRLLSERSSRNLYARGFVGARVGDGPWSLGMGFSTANVHAMDGVDLLYANAQRIAQSGTTGDVRFAVRRDGEHDRVGLLTFYDRVSMRHDVTYLGFLQMWGDSVTYQPDLPYHVVPWTHEVTNHDRTRTWGLQVSYDRDLTAPGWRLGFEAVVNRKWHPSIPDYEIQNIPRDPGTSWAYEFGLGVSRSRNGSTFGMDVGFQPIWSNTWQTSDIAVSGASGITVLRGWKTIENDFFFTNVLLRAGLTQTLGRFEAQLGLEVRSYQYRLQQRDHVHGTYRDQDEGWMEWAPAAGVSYRFADGWELRYTGRLTTGTGRPGVRYDVAVPSQLYGSTDFLVAPEAPLTLQDAVVQTHQFSVQVPIR